MAEAKAEAEAEVQAKAGAEAKAQAQNNADAKAEAEAISSRSDLHKTNKTKVLKSLSYNINERVYVNQRQFNSR